MRILDLPQGGGKTMALVRYMLKPGNEDVVYVAPTRAQAQKGALVYAEQISGQKQDYRRFVSVGDVQARGFVGKRFVVDEADAVLHSFLGGPVEEIALTSASWKEKR